MKKLEMVLALAAALALPVAARAEYSGFEAQASFYETINGKWSPGFKAQTAMYHEGYAIGGFIGENEAAGLAGIWRVFEFPISRDFVIATHMGASTDLWQGDRPAGEDNAANVAYFFEPRFGWSHINGKVEMGLVIQCLTMDHESHEWTFGLNISFMPNKLPGQVTTKATATIEGDLARWRAYDMVASDGSYPLESGD